MAEISDTSIQPLAEWTGGTRVTLAIVFTDIVGSTALGVELGDEKMSEVRLAHFAHSRALLAQHGGREIKTIGDSVLAVFRSVGAALDYAHGLHFDPGPKELHAKGVRAGVHIGSVDVVGNDIFGTEVAVAARVVHAIESAEIWISDQARQDIARAGARRHRDLEWQAHNDVELKGVGTVTLWSLVTARPLDGVSPTVPSARYSDGEEASVPVQPVERKLAAMVAALPLPDKPSIAALPFANMSSEPEQEFLADGIAEDVITALSRHPSLFVIARNSCFTYKGRDVEVRQVGRELGVRYVLAGSLRKAGVRIRVSTQLVEAETGNHVWAERYDRDLDDLFAVQAEIAEAVATAIAPVIAGAERQRAMRKPPENLDAWAAYQRGLWHLSTSSAEENVMAIEFFQRAIDLDPKFTGGYCGLAAAQNRAAIPFATHDLWEMLRSSEMLTRRAVALNDADAEVRACLANVLWIQGDYAGALAEAEQALALSPNLAIAHREVGSALVLSGRRAEGTAALEKSFRLDSRDPRLANTLLLIAMSAYLSRDYGTAATIAQRIIRSFPDYPLSYRWLAAALGQLGRYEEAKKALDKAAAVRPTSFDTFVRSRPPYMRPEDYAHMLEGLRKAGWEG